MRGFLSVEFYKIWGSNRRSNQATTLSEYSKNTLQDAIFYASKFFNLTCENTEKSTKFKVYLLGLINIGYEYKKS